MSQGCVLATRRHLPALLRNADERLHHDVWHLDRTDSVRRIRRPRRRRRFDYRRAAVHGRLVSARNR